MSYKGRWVIAVVSWVSAVIVTWTFWGPILHWLQGMVPEGAKLAWLGKLICVILVGYFGGIALPLIIFAFGFFVLVQD